jgi:uncharacterized protein YecT (DUF1311 family)
MKIIATAVCACVPLVALCAEPREDVVAAMVRATHMSQADILGSLKRCDGTTVDMKTCASYSFTAEDIRLNQIYFTVLKISDATGARKSLVESQRAWIKYRDLACVDLTRDFWSRLNVLTVNMRLGRCQSRDTRVAHKLVVRLALTMLRSPVCLPLQRLTIACLMTKRSCTPCSFFAAATICLNQSVRDQARGAGADNDLNSESHETSMAAR